MTTLQNVRNKEFAESIAAALGATVKALPFPVPYLNEMINIPLVILPTIYEPSEWSMALLKKMLEFSKQFYEGKHLLEVGSGSGCLSIALSKLRRPQRIHCVDINPIAIACTKINVILSQFEDKIDVGRSDLVQKLTKENDTKYDIIFGNLPQLPKSELLHVEELYDYYSIEDLTEDDKKFSRYGLGLIAKLLRESHKVIKPHGEVIFVLSGRCGYEIIRFVLEQRGFENIRISNEKRILQEMSGDFIGIVGMEKELPEGDMYASKLRFFETEYSQETISADEAFTLLRNKQNVYHELCIVQATRK